jgi:hypothetical protein
MLRQRNDCYLDTHAARKNWMNRIPLRRQRGQEESYLAVLLGAAIAPECFARGAEKTPRTTLRCSRNSGSTRSASG